jgi:hypothetical protein
MQVENGLIFAKNTVLNNIMFRYGLTGSTEVRALLDFGMDHSKTGILPVCLSVKQRIISQNGFVPAISLVGYAGIGHLASKTFRLDNDGVFEIDDDFAYNFIVAFENKITDRLSLGYNIATFSFHEDLSVTACLGYGFTNKLSGFAEYFAHFEKENRTNHHTDVGLLYLITDDLQIDFAVGISLFDDNSDVFVTAGVSFRF